MNILVTNDDGIDAVGIKILANHLKKYGKVYIVAPITHMSGASHSFTLSDITVQSKDVLDNVISYQCSSSPVDCVRVGLALIDEKIDVVFSGINSGLNVGTDILYSGTVGAAREAVVEGVPAVAISSDFDNVLSNEPELDDLLDTIMSKKLYSSKYVLNANFPTKKFANSKGIRVSKQGVKIYKTKFIESTNGLFKQEDDGITLDINQDTDVYLSENGYITITPLKIDQTDIQVYDKLKNDIK